MHRADLLKYSAPETDLVFQDCPPLVGVFDRRSGRTHLLQAVSVELLKAARSPGTVDDLVQRVRDSVDLEADAGEDVDAILRARIAELGDLDLLDLVY